MQAEKFTTVPAHPHGTLRPPRGEAKTGIRGAATAICNEIAKGLIDLWRGKLGSFLELILFGIFFLVINFAIGRGTIQQDRLAPIMLGFVGYIFFHMQTNRLFWGLLGEIQSGTLEQLYLSPLPSWLLTVGMTVASVVEATLTAVLLSLLINLVVPVTIPLQWAALLPLVMLVLGSVGYSLILGGLTLRFKRLEILKDLFQTAVLIFDGVFVSLDRMPGWMATIARFLPLTPGVEVLHKTLLEGSRWGHWPAMGRSCGWWATRRPTCCSASSSFAGVSASPSDGARRDSTDRFPWTNIGYAVREGSVHRAQLPGRLPVLLLNIHLGISPPSS